MGKGFGAKPFIFNLKNWGRVEVTLILKYIYILNCQFYTYN